MGGRRQNHVNVNGKKMTRRSSRGFTLLDRSALLDVTAAKRVCDRGTCGACTVMLRCKSSSRAGMLAVEGQGRRSRTAESPTGRQARRGPRFRQRSTHSSAASATPGFVVAMRPLNRTDATPARSKGPSGNICRCGTYEQMRHAIASFAGRKKEAKMAILGPTAPTSAPEITRIDGRKSRPAAPNTASTSPPRQCCTPPSCARLFAHEKVKSIDTLGRREVPGVKAVHIIADPAKNKNCLRRDEIVAIAADTENTSPMPFVPSRGGLEVPSLPVAEETHKRTIRKRHPRSSMKVRDNLRPGGRRTTGTSRTLHKRPTPWSKDLWRADYLHQCLDHTAGCRVERHGSLTVWASTQAVSGTAGALATTSKIRQPK